MNFEIDSEKERGWILRILNRVYPDPLDIDTVKKQLIDLRFLSGDSDIRGNIAYLKEKGLIKIEDVGNGIIKRTVASLTANGKDLIDGAVPTVVGVSL